MSRHISPACRETPVRDVLSQDTTGPTTVTCRSSGPGSTRARGFWAISWRLGTARERTGALSLLVAHFCGNGPCMIVSGHGKSAGSRHARISTTTDKTGRGNIGLVLGDKNWSRITAGMVHVMPSQCSYLLCTTYHRSQLREHGNSLGAPQLRCWSAKVAAGRWGRPRPAESGGSSRTQPPADSALPRAHRRKDSSGSRGRGHRAAHTALRTSRRRAGTGWRGHRLRPIRRISPSMLTMYAVFPMSSIDVGRSRSSATVRRPWCVTR
jgi:hypothetical protein